jgi:predicted ATPase
MIERVLIINGKQIEFKPITIIHGANGCGKSDLLNSIWTRIIHIQNELFYDGDTFVYGDILTKKITYINSKRSTFCKMGNLDLSGNRQILLKDVKELVQLAGLKEQLIYKSSGQLNLLTILYEAKSSDILIIDDIEASLHVDNQRKLIDMILEINPEIQLICTTHSPVLVGSRRECMIALD